MPNKNLTLSIDETLLQRARVLAAEERTSVNAIIRDALVGRIARSTTEQRRKEAGRQLAELSAARPHTLPEDWRFDRKRPAT